MKTSLIAALITCTAACSSQSSSSSSRDRPRAEATSSTSSASSTTSANDMNDAFSGDGYVRDARALYAQVQGVVGCENPFEDDEPGYSPHPSASSAGFCNLVRPPDTSGGADGYFVVWPSAEARNADPILEGCGQITNPDDLTGDRRYIVIGGNWGIAGVYRSAAEQIANQTNGQIYAC